MLHVWEKLIYGLLAPLAACRAAPQPSPATGTSNVNGRRLQGRFLQITDIHPDPFYKTYSSTSDACHHGRGSAGPYGAEASGCDAPFSLVNETFKWIDEHLKDKIDFVVWTGDSARHDNDEKLPRTPKQIVDQNAFIVSKFAEVFSKARHSEEGVLSQHYSVPIVPTFGNNDVMPHNIMLEGPNKWTNRYLEIWRSFIPEAQRHSFQQGGWFYVEVIPKTLAVFSLNTMYFFDSNSGVDGCANKHEPGYEHMEWLRVQLHSMRERGMKAILIGHVPPARTDSKLSWDETCWQKFTLWQRQYRDVILGSLFGHMNIDHFILHDFKDLTKDAKKGRMASVNALDDPENRVTMMEDGELTVASASSYLSDLGDIWAELPAPLSSGQLSAPSDDSGDCSQYSPLQRVMSLLRNPRKGRKDKKGDRKKGFLHKIGGRYAERYSVTHVPPSVVPTYFPTLRVYTYNISGLEDIVVPARPMLPPRLTASHLPSFDDTDYQKEVRNAVRKHKKRKQKHAVKRKKYKFKVPSPPTKSAPPGPAYSPQSLTFLGYVQYFANLTKINNHDGKHERHQGSTRPTNPFEYEVEYNTTDDGQYKLEDLTVRSYLDLAHRIGCDKVECRKVRESDSSEQDDEYHVDHLAEDIELKRSNKGKHKKHKKLDPSGAWYTFIDRAFVRTKSTRDLEREFTAQDTPQLDGTSQEVMEL